MRVVQFRPETVEKTKMLLPIVKIEADVYCPKCKKEALLYFMTAHDIVIYKRVCQSCGHQVMEQVPVDIKEDHVFYRREFINKLFCGFTWTDNEKRIHHVGGFSFVSSEDEVSAKFLLEKNITKKEKKLE